tara:strand:+ start:579 stop:980 length:402 start_codon:yes stop_codon:yes gene_type:complete
LIIREPLEAITKGPNCLITTEILTVRTAADIRRENLRYLIDTKFQGVRNRLAKHIGVTHMQIARIFHSGSSARNVGDRLARKIELGCELETGWLDQDHAKSDNIMQKFNSLDVEGQVAIRQMLDALVTRRKID